MKDSRKIKILILILFLIEITSLFLTYKSFLNKEINKIKETHEVKNRTFSLFIENEEGNYSEYIESNLFPEGYKINLDKSKCVDTNGNEVKGILSGTGTNITVKSTTTSYCYLYFDIGTTDTEKLIENVSSDVLWESTLKDDGYRYVGTNPDNYICFGTTNISTCTGNTDLYMYRIIGIFEDSEGEQHLKLIKKEALNTSYAWNADYQNDVSWSVSDIYKGINGSYFLTNSTYSYMQDTNWTDKIAIWDYTATNTKTYESSGPNYYNSVTVQNIYLHEMNRSSKTSSVGVWDTVSSKIGLMYVSDYLLSLGNSALSYTSYTNRTTLKTGWIHLSNNNTDVFQYEWTLSRYGDNYGYYDAYAVSQDGHVGALDVFIDYISVRPVFYLTSDVTLSGGGTSESPYIIS